MPNAARSYLGLIWWVLEPAMQMGAYWLVFGLILKTGGPDYLPMLLIGLTLWQWMKSCITHGGYAVWTNLPLIRQVQLPPLVFPLVQMLADTIKFFYIFALLLVILWCVGYPPNMAYFALPLVFVAVFLVAAGAGFVVAAVVPLLPDLRFVIEQVLTVVMFLSGVVFSLESGALADARGHGTESDRRADGSDARHPDARRVAELGRPDQGQHRSPSRSA